MSVPSLSYDRVKLRSKRLLTCATRTDPVAGLLAHAVHIPKAHLAADATLNAPERTQSAAVAFLCLDPLCPRVHHWYSGLYFGARTEAQVLKKDLSLGCELDQSLVEIKVIHKHGALAKNTAGARALACAIGVGVGVASSIGVAKVGRVHSTNGGATAVALGVAICFVKSLYREAVGERYPRRAAG
ncbi:hypothetical protein HG530_015666 [Fusarium avenaceum]|nr:hypothetical protein HG530_015666 [Fusarium avenaceum]